MPRPKTDIARSEALTRAWKSGDEQSSKPGPRPSWSTEQIVGAGISLYDDQGLTGFSLAKLASAIGLTTNALYRYVASREELEALIRDEALGAPGSASADHWQDSVRLWARALAMRYRRHKWLAQLPARIPYTPNALAWLDALLTALASAGFDPDLQLAAATLLDSHVRACAVAASDQESTRSLTLPSDFQALLVDRGLRRVAQIVTDGRYVEVEADSLQMMEFGLETFLLGLETRLRRS